MINILCVLFVMSDYYIHTSRCVGIYLYGITYIFFKCMVTHNLYLLLFLYDLFYLFLVCKWDVYFGLSKYTEETFMNSLII